MSLYAIFSGKSLNKPVPSFESLNFSKHLICTTSDLKKANDIFDKESLSNLKWAQLVCLSTNKIISSSVSYDILKPVSYLFDTDD